MKETKVVPLNIEEISSLSPEEEIIFTYEKTAYLVAFKFLNFRLDIIKPPVHFRTNAALFLHHILAAVLSQDMQDNKPISFENEVVFYPVSKTLEQTDLKAISDRIEPMGYTLSPQALILGCKGLPST